MVAVIRRKYSSCIRGNEGLSGPEKSSAPDLKNRQQFRNAVLYAAMPQEMVATFPTLMIDTEGSRVIKKNFTVLLQSFVILLPLPEGCAWPLHSCLISERTGA